MAPSPILSLDGGITTPAELSPLVLALSFGGHGTNYGSLHCTWLGGVEAQRKGREEISRNLAKVSLLIFSCEHNERHLKSRMVKSLAEIGGFIFVSCVICTSDLLLHLLFKPWRPGPKLPISILCCRMALPNVSAGTELSHLRVNTEPRLSKEPSLGMCRGCRWYRRQK